MMLLPTMWFVVWLHAAIAMLAAAQSGDPCDELLDTVEPCTCVDATLDCSAVESGDQLLTIPGLQNGQSLNFTVIKLNDNCRITAIPAAAFGDHYAVYEYSFSRNPRLQSIDGSVFSPASAETAVTVDVYGNYELQSFPFDAIRNYRNLRYVGLYSNGLRDVPDSAFKDGSPELQTILLSDNRISSIGYQAFHGLPSLDTVVMESNRLTTLDSYDLLFSTRVRTMILANNFLRNIQPGFANMLPASTIFAGNQMETLNQETWEPLFINFVDELDQGTLQFGGNPFVCDCRMKWLYDMKEMEQFIGTTIWCWNLDQHNPLWTLDESFFADC